MFGDALSPMWLRWEAVGELTTDDGRCDRAPDRKEIADTTCPRTSATTPGAPRMPEHYPTHTSTIVPAWVG